MKLLIVLLLLASAVLVLALRTEADADFYGIVESRPAGKTGTWIIGGREVVVTERTELDEDDGPLVVGACAEVEYKGTWVKEIESEKMYKCGK